MNAFLISFLVFGFLLTFNSPSRAHDRSKHTGVVMPGINVLVYNQAQVPWPSLGRAERDATRIFHYVGIEVTWWNCNPAMTGLHQEANCKHEVRPTELVLRILPEIAVVPGVIHGRAMGFAFGYLASVSFSRVKGEARKFGVSTYDVLGPAIAHEIGHLLGQQGHSPTGIMRECWQRSDYEAPTLDALKFSAEQAEQMRAEVRERERQQAAAASSLTVSSDRSPGVDPL